MKIRIIASLILLLVPAIAAAQQAEEFGAKALLIVDPGSELSERVTTLMLEEIGRIRGIEIRPWGTEWSSDPQWVLSVSIEMTDPDPNQKDAPRQFYMGVAFSRSETVIDEQILQREVERRFRLDEATMIQILNEARTSVGEFKAMWLAHGRVDSDLAATCRKAAKVFDENFIAPERRQFAMEKAKQEAERRSKRRIR